jgi:hypothetical protein
MEADADRLNSKLAGAVVIDMDEVRKRKAMNEESIGTAPRDPFSEASLSVWAVVLLIVFAAMFLPRR